MFMFFKERGENVKVKDVLELPSLEEAFTLAGHSGLYRNVQHVNMMDAPDIIHYLSKDDLLLTTAYHFKDDPSALLSLIRKMHERNCAGLCVKTKRFLKELPSDVLALANKLSFPIIEIPESVALGDVVNNTLGTILNTRTNELQQAIHAHQQFTNHVLSGRSIDELLQNLSLMIGYPVLLLNQHFKLLTQTHYDEKASESSKKWNTQNTSFFLKKTPYSCFSIRDTHEVFSAFPVPTHEKRCGSLLVEENLAKLDQGKILMIEQAANVIAFELMKESALKQYERRAKNEFFTNFVDGKFTSKDEIRNRTKEFGLNCEQKYILIATKLDRNEKGISFTAHQMETDVVYEFLEEELESIPWPCHFFLKGTIGVIFVEVNDRWIGLHETIISALQHIQKGVLASFQRTISFGISSITQNLFEIESAYEEALDALDTGHFSGSMQFIQTYQTKDVTELLRVVPRQELKKFYDHTLQKLSSHTQDEEQRLLHTLSVFLETHCQISETAKRLYVHRNTVIYRLEKCEELLGKSLKDPDTTLRLRLALRIGTML
jgi:purine catabolism regulator